MHADRYDNQISTQSGQAAEAYRRGVDCFLAADIGAEEAFLAAIAADREFALAYAALARSRQTMADIQGARQAMAEAKASTAAMTEREQSHIHCLDLLIKGKSAEAYQAILKHLECYPRDVMIAQPCTGVFGLIGFSGRPGRESEHLAFTYRIAQHYGEDWWFLTQLGFAQMECGQVAVAEDTMARALEGNPRNANAAHYLAHLYYEMGASKQAMHYLDDWMPDYSREALLHCHISWHQALCALAVGDETGMWQIIDECVAPAGAWGPPINVLTDVVAFLKRAELAGYEVAQARWQQISDYALNKFPRPGVAFVDVHAALAHAMADNRDALNDIINANKSPASDVVQALARAFQALAEQSWSRADEQLTVAMVDHARIGGSRAQRDLIEFLLADVLKRQGKTADAKRLLAMRRPVSARANGLL